MSRFAPLPMPMCSFTAPLVGGGLPLYSQGRYSEPLSLRGQSVWLRAAVGLNLAMWLIRDASLQSFLVCSLFINIVLYCLLVRGEPFSLALVVESAASVAAKQGIVARAAAAAAAQSHSMAAHASAAHLTQAGMQQRAGFNGASNEAQAMAFAQQQQQQQHMSGASPRRTPTSILKRVSSPTAAASRVPATASASSSAPVSAPMSEDEGGARDTVSGYSTATSDHEQPASAATTTASSSASLASMGIGGSEASSPMIAPKSLAAAGGVPPPLSTTAEEVPVVVAGLTSRHSTSDGESCWSRGSGPSYDVRIGPNYRKLGKKAPSKPAMFECVGVDLFNAPEGKLDNVVQHLQLPWIAKRREDNSSSSGDDAASSPSSSSSSVLCAPSSAPPECPLPSVMDPVLHASDSYELDPRVLETDATLGVPTLFVINFQIPTYAPAYFSSREDGEGFSVVLYFQITAETLEELRSGAAQEDGGTPLSGATQLFKEFVNNATEYEYHSRFKAIAKVCNAAQANLGMAARSAMRMYAAKPMLTGPHTHSFHRSPGVIEADIDLHRFCLAARKGVFGFLNALSSLVVDVGLVIEAGRDGVEEELPERILGCAHISHFDPNQAKSLSFYIEEGRKQRAQRKLQGQE